MQTNHRRMTSTLLVRVQEHGAMLTRGATGWKMRTKGLAAGFPKNDAEKPQRGEEEGRRCIWY